MTTYLPTGEQMSVYDAAMKYKESGTPLIVLAGKEYGTGSSRDWAAKGRLRRVLVEGGGITVSRFLQAGLLDRLHVTVAPLLIGSGRAALTLPAIETLAQALRPRCRHFHLGEDVLFDLDLR